MSDEAGAGDGEGGGGHESEGEREAKQAEEEEEEEEEEEDSEDEEDDDEQEEVGIALQLPQRATRGHAYQRLIGEALEEDQAFWGHNTWADEEEDDDYKCSEGEEVYEDVIDSDFDRPEEDEESESSDRGGRERDPRSKGGRRGQGEALAERQRDRDRKRKKREDEEEDRDERKKTRKQAFELMWKKRQAKREKEERDRREKKRQAKREQHKEEKRQKIALKGEVQEADPGRKSKKDYGRPKQKQERKQEVSIGEARQLRMTRGRLLRGEDHGGSSTSDEQGHPSSNISNTQKRKRRQKKPPERTQERRREMTREEHLEEARRTEEKNLAVLLAMEERDEARRLRHVFDLKKNIYAGDYDRYFSWASWLVVGDQAAEAEDEAALSGAVVTAEEHQSLSQQQTLETKQEVQSQDGDNEDTIRMPSEGSTAHMQGKERCKNTIDATFPATEEALQTDASPTTKRKHSCSMEAEEAVTLAVDDVGSVLHTERVIEQADTAESGGKELRGTTVDEVQAPKNCMQRTLSECELAEQIEKKEGQDGNRSVTEFSCSSHTTCQAAASLKRYTPAEPHLQDRASEKVPEDVKQRSNQSLGANQQVEGDEALAEAKENEEYAMELRMFTDGKFPDIYTQQPLSSPTPLRCIITGQRAKYRDPLTGAPYATVHAFKSLRKAIQTRRKQQLLQMLHKIKIDRPQRPQTCEVPLVDISLSDAGACSAAYRRVQQHSISTAEGVSAAADVRTKEVLGAKQSADSGKVFVQIPSGGVPDRVLSPGTSAAAAAPAGNDAYLYLSTDTSVCDRGSIGNSGDARGYGGHVESRAADAVSVQSRQRKAAAGAHTGPVRKILASTKSFITLSCPQRNRSSAEDDVCTSIAVEAWTNSGGAEQKRRRNARNLAACEKKAGRNRGTRKLL